MDHLPLPSRQFWPDDLEPYPPIPCICERIQDGPGAGQFYDGGDFASYPARIGSQWQHWVMHGPSDFKSSLLAETPRPSELRGLLPLLQSWLFFGMIHLVLQPAMLYHESDYCDTTPDGRITLHTRGLMARLGSWKEVATRWSELQRGDMLRACSCAFEIAKNAIALAETRLKSEPLHDHQYSQVQMSLASICQTMLGFVGNTIQAVGFTRDTFSVEPFNQEEVKRLRRLEWCPSLIGAESQIRMQPHLKWYFLHLAQPKVGLSHALCNTRECRHAHIEPERYQLPHESDDCKCEPLGPDLASIATCLNAGTFPLFDVLGDSIEDVRLHITPRTSESRYVALSHVWADGLGNPNATSLRRCQLLRIKRIVEGIEAPVVDNSQGILLLWCDTLLVPNTVPVPRGLSLEEEAGFLSRSDTVEARRLKRLALAGMRDVYAEATYVLVLDRMLLACATAQMDEIEFGVRLSISRWQTRVWTLQEGALPATLVARAADRYVDVDYLVRSIYLDRGLHDPDVEDPALRYICTTVAVRLSSLRIMSETGEFSLWNAAASIRQRGVHCPEDEALVLGSILGLDLTSISAHDGLAERMSVMWTLLATRPQNGVPASFIFNECKRLSIPGLRWAPLSLRGTSSLPKTIDGFDKRHNFGTLSADGLCCRFSGWRVKPMSVRRAFYLPHTARNYADVTPVCYIQIPDRTWFELELTEASALQGVAQQSLFALFEKEHYQDWRIVINDGKSLLGHIEINSDRPLVFRSRSPVHIRPLDEFTSLCLNSSPARVAKLLQCSASRNLQAIAALGRTMSALIHQWIVEQDLFFLRSLFQLILILKKLWHYWCRVWWTDFVPLFSQGVDGSFPLPPFKIATLAHAMCVVLTGRFLTVTETYPNEHEWIVD